MSLDHFCYWIDKNYDRTNIIIHTSGLIMWIIGVLGNLVNVVVFRHKNMAHQPINLIFWWLSITDLLELIICMLYDFSWDLTFLKTDGEFAPRIHIDDFVRYLILVYLFLVIHSITICFNIVLVFCQYRVVANPLINHKDFMNNRSIKLTVICTYILSFVLHMPFWYIYKIDHNGQNGWIVLLRSYEDTLAVIIYFVIFGIILRIGPLIVLTTCYILLLFELNNSHRNRQRLGMEARQLSKAQRNVNRMNVTIIVIILMEIPLGMDSFFLFSHNRVCRKVLNETILLPFVTLNCSYSIFCYLFRIKKYRETLKLLLSERNWFRSRAHVAEQVNLELQPL